MRGLSEWDMNLCGSQAEGHREGLLGKQKEPEQALVVWIGHAGTDWFPLIGNPRIVIDTEQPGKPVVIPILSFFKPDLKINKDGFFAECCDYLRIGN